MAKFFLIKNVIKNKIWLTLNFFVSFQWWTKEYILLLINLTTSCIMLKGKLKQNKAKQEKQ